MRRPLPISRDTKVSVVVVRLEPRELARIERAAREAGVSMESFLAAAALLVAHEMRAPIHVEDGQAEVTDALREALSNFQSVRQQIDSKTPVDSLFPS
jgi:signal transduction histidine kinase